MEMGRVGITAEHRTGGLRRRGATLIPAAIVAVLTMALASQANATPYVAKAWGANGSGQLGNGTTEGPEKCESSSVCSTTPVAVNKLSGVIAITGGDRHSIALLENGKVMAWGNNQQGQLGNGTTVASDVPVEVIGLSEVTAIAAGSRYNLALLKSGKLMAWGENAFGELGNGTKNNSDVPVEVTGLSEPVKAIAAAEDHALAVLESGKVMAWGFGGGGALGNGEAKTSTVPVSVCALGTVGSCPTGPYLSEATAVAGGGGGSEHSLALLKTGAVVATDKGSWATAAKPAATYRFKSKD
jgi:alpha-tubulin suppressor-like RCC1 family protein